MMNLRTYPRFVELVRKKIDVGKSLMKDLIVGKGKTTDDPAI
jgi:hypothetical protein